MKLKRMELKNFKQFKEADYDFDNVTTFQGCNEAGKTSLLDAYLWVLFGMDSKLKQLLSGVVKLDENNKMQIGIETSVRLQFDKFSLMKTHAEKIKVDKLTKRETTKADISYFVDDNPVALKDFKKFVFENICDEEKFKLLTLPHYFASLNWKDQRTILEPLIKDTSKASEDDQKKFVLVLDDVAKTGINACKTNWNRSKRAIDDDVEKTDTKIEENARHILKEKTPQKLLEKKEEVESEIEKLTKKLTNSDLELEKVLKPLHKDLIEVKNERSRAELNSKSLIREIESHNQSIDILKQRSEQLSKEIELTDEKKKAQEEMILEAENALDVLRSLFREISATQESEEVSPNCITCNALLPVEKQAENFRKWKKTQLDMNNKEGKALAAKIKKTKETNFDEIKEKYIVQLKSNLEEIETLKKSIEDKLTIITGNNKAKAENEKKADSINLRIETTKSDHAIANRNLKITKTDLEEELSEIKENLSKFTESETAKTREKELKKELKELQAKALVLVNKLALLDQLEREHMSRIEKAINDKIEGGGIKFRMFKTLKNGLTEQDCEMLIMSKEGALVPYSQANTGGKAVAGAKIINLLQGFYYVSVPVWFDNMESVDDLPEINAQVIRLEKVKSAKKLRKV